MGWVGVITVVALACCIAWVLYKLYKAMGR